MIRCCVDRALPPARQYHADVAAFTEATRRDHFARRNPAAFPGESAALLTSAHWAPGRTLGIEFRGGTRAARAVVMQAAAEWMEHANIRIVPVDSGAPIRCAFDPGGSWSYVGSEILAAPPDEPTMNIGWGPDLPTCLHELGHTLGLVHEHQLPDAAIPWDVPAVLRYYEGPPNRWSEAMTRSNVLDRYSGATLTNGGYDRHSIMQYPTPPELLTDPSFAVGWNTALSDGDRAFIAAIYPRA